jgi:hypothetical protein
MLCFGCQQSRRLKYEEGLAAAFERAKTYVPQVKDYLDSSVPPSASRSLCLTRQRLSFRFWTGFKRRVRNANILDTGITHEQLHFIGLFGHGTSFF